MATTDQAAFDAIVTLLQATNVFQSVKRGAKDKILFPSDGEVPFACLWPTGANPVDSYDNGDYIRKVSYTLAIVTRDDDPEARTSALATLEAYARNALSKQSFGGFTFPGLSDLGPSSWPDPTHPEQRVELAGSFVYEVLTPTSNDTTNTYVE